MILAQQLASYDLVHWIIIAIVLCGIVGIALIAARKAGITVPDWVWQILGIILVVVVAVLAIKFLAGML